MINMLQHGYINTNLDLSVDSTLLVIELLAFVGVHLEVVEGKLLLDALLELSSLLQCQGVGFGNDGDDIDDVGQLLEDDNIDGLQRVASRLDEEQAAVNTGVLDVSLTLGRKLLAQVGGVLILDVLDDSVPAAIVVHQVSVSGSVNDVQLESHAVLLNVVRNGVDLGCGSDVLIRDHATFRVNKMRGEDGVDES